MVNVPPGCTCLVETWTRRRCGSECAAPAGATSPTAAANAIVAAPSPRALRRRDADAMVVLPAGLPAAAYGARRSRTTCVEGAGGLARAIAPSERHGVPSGPGIKFSHALAEVGPWGRADFS